MLIKIAPDLTLNELDDVVAIARRRKVDGMIVGNTTMLRPDWLKDQATAQEAGGLSGRPLFALATRMLAETYVRVEGAFPLIGTGGIDSGATALAKIRAGACLVQVYSSLVFRGLALVGEIKTVLADELRRGGHAGLDELVGADAAAMTAEDWPEFSAGPIRPRVRRVPPPDGGSSPRSANRARPAPAPRRHARRASRCWRS